MRIMVVDGIPKGYVDKLPFKNGDSILFLGEIEGMPGHVAVVTRDGKTHFGFHHDNFREPLEETVAPPEKRSRGKEVPMLVTRIYVKVNNIGTDEVTLFTDLPSPMPHITDQNMASMFHVESGKGVDYALANFPDVPIETLDANTGVRNSVHTIPAEPGRWYGHPIEDKP